MASLFTIVIAPAAFVTCRFCCDAIRYVVGILAGYKVKSLVVSAGLSDASDLNTARVPAASTSTSSPPSASSQ
ncbi:hypothetical protein IE81DRAFT_323580 [Ceraceosorus guamensis]|uniref:Uncharacterized protein n=1 Tax=Ceraceosorus guamensis TaxID=1522189 RepID=A0A316VY87_9BASI|nr:hypothetical protein IE81DRAFT_323580 [Ceraceosorus guamensis]PWN42419.1 hypothetical protein IE81DRAFT_323580 [Ceraceosorus guamensis]